MKPNYDAIVVGSGPNGFAAAITLQRAGLAVLLVEGKDVLGGGVRSAPLTLPGYIHDVCSAVHPLAADSPVFKQLNLEQFGLEYLKPEYAVAHPFDDGSAATIQSSIEVTAGQFGKDADNYKKVFSTLIKEWSSVSSALVAPLHLTAYSNAKARFAYYALSSGAQFAKHHFKTGLSFLYDQYKEQLNAVNYDRTEIVPGAFAEYTFTPNEKFDLANFYKGIETIPYFHRYFADMKKH